MSFAVVLMAGAASCSSVPPLATGSLTGRLTDARSIPLENVRITLRNITTGSEIQAITSRGGRYRFTGLPAGEYQLTAFGPHGEGHLQEILVSAGHESHVQAAMELPPTHGDFDARVTKQTVRPPLAAFWGASLAAGAVEPRLATLEITVETESLQKLPIESTKRPRSGLDEASNSSKAQRFGTSSRENSPINGPDSIAQRSIPRPHSSEIAAEIAPTLPIPSAIPELSIGALDFGSIPPRALSDPNGDPSRSAPHDASESLNQEQLQNLPLRDREWHSFLVEPVADVRANEETPPASQEAAQSEASIDGMPVRSLFSGTAAGSRRRSADSAVQPVSESAIATLGPARSGRVREPLQGEGISIETQRGTGQLHGQAFGFNRRNAWSARNPFTRWVKEIAPASSGAVPVFAAQQSSPGDRETLWGIGVGGVLRKPRLFWFGALDGFERNDPSIATVRHAESFFAQPSNDRMQLLSAQLGLSSVDPVGEGLNAYSKLLENLAQLLGPAPRSSSQLMAFTRFDGSVGERNRFTIDASASSLRSPGGGFGRATEFYGTHSFGSLRGQQQWTLARWETFITPNLLATTTGSFAHKVQIAGSATPSAFERSLNINAWGQLPQIVVDSRNGFTIGNPSRFGRGSYPDEHLYFAQQQLSWIRNEVMLKAGFEVSHDNDATSQLRNQTGTYYYASIEDFASDALAFSSFGLSGQLDPMHQHNCDQRGGPWRDSAGVLHGLGYLPCYSYYSQTMGPSNWWLSTNDWAGYLTAQFEPTKSIAFTVGMRWELQQLPSAIAMLRNADLPLTERLPEPGNQWAPRAAFAWGTSKSRWPILRFGYGMYFARTTNSVIETALTHTGSAKGDLEFYMRPTDNLGAGGAPPFPYVLAGAPATAVKPGAVEFAPNLRNGEIHQAEAGVEENLPGHFQIQANVAASLGRRLPVTFDANIDPATNPKTITYLIDDGNNSGPIKSPQLTVPFFANWPSATSHSGFSGRLNPNYQQVSEIFSRANSTYEAAFLRIARSSRNLMVRARYIYGHAMDWNPDETSLLGPSTLDPIDFRQEYGTSSLDVRHSATAAIILRSRWKLKNIAGQVVNGWQLGSIAYFHSGLPFSMRTAGALPKEFNLSGTAIVGLGTGMSGYGGDNRVYGVGRNTFRYPATWKADLQLSKRFELGEMRQVELMAESFNLFNHQNVTELETTGYSIAAGTANGGFPRLTYLTGLKSGQTEFGKPLAINASDLLRERQIQIGARLRF